MTSTKAKPLSLTNITGEAVKAARMKRGEDQGAYWRRYGVTQSGGSRYESGRSIHKPLRLLIALVEGKTALSLIESGAAAGKL